MIKVIIFDVDGVLIPNKRVFSFALVNKHKIPKEKLAEFFDGPFQKCLTGDSDLKEAIVPHLNRWGWKTDVEEVMDDWFRLDGSVDNELIKYIQGLRKKGILCFIATNNEKYRFQYMLDKLGFAKSFDKAFASAHLGHQKPSQDFFSKMFKELKNVEKNEILFVDDDKENIYGAKNFGFHAELYTSLENLKNKIKVLNTK